MRESRKPPLPDTTSGMTPKASHRRMVVPLDLVGFAIRLVEFLTVVLAGLVALYLWQEQTGETIIGDYYRTTFIGAMVFALIAEVTGAYDTECHFSLRLSWQRVMASWVVTSLFLIAIGFLLSVSGDFSRGWAITWFVTASVMLAGTRAAMTLWVRRLKGKGIFNSRVAIYGASEQGQKLAQYIRTDPRLTITLVGFFDDRRDGRVPVTIDDLPVFGTSEDLVEMIRDGLIDQVIIALPWSASLRIQQVVAKFALTPVRIRLAPDLANFAFSRRPLVLLGDLPVITLFERPISGMDAIIKRAEDLILAGIIITLLSPIMLLVAIAVRLDSPGPILFRQPREGFNNQSFMVYKFRSMTCDLCEETDIHQATRNDQRITRVGRFIRAASLDELPQLFNVIEGSMSLVGPRPHAPSTRANGRLFHEVVHTYAARHKVKPGITGWAQVCGWRGETDTEEKLVRRLEHDLYYIENWSVPFDVYILLKTIGAVAFPKNAF